MAHPDLPDLIRALAAEWIANGEAVSLEAINCGLCDDFATAIESRVRDELGRDVICESVGPAGFMLPDPEDVHGGPFDRELLAKHWPKVQPPEGLDWDDLDRLSVDAGFSEGTHVWVIHDGRFYDAEAPEGVDNFFDFPFFQRVVASWIDERAPHLAM